MTISDTRPAAPPPADAATTADPFPYGWRYVKMAGPDGIVRTERVPLTADQAWHPEEGDQVTENSQHERWRTYLGSVFAARLAGDPTAAVLSDVLVKWDHPTVRPTGPDVAVLLGVQEQRVWGTFDVAEEGARPALVIEIVSPSSTETDRSGKRDEYEAVGVPLYVLVDAVGLRDPAPLRLIAYRLGATGYEVMPPDERGWLWLEPVRVWLGVEHGRPRCYDEAGQPIPDYLEQAAARAEAETRAAAAEARVRELEAELRRLRGTP